MKVKDAQFFAVVSSFLNVYLVKNRSCSSNTVKSYEDALNLFFTFLETAKAIPRQRANWSHFTRQNIQEFMDWLEKVRNCNRQTQLQRLAAIRSFVRYGGIIDLRVISIQADVEKIRYRKPAPALVGYLTKEGLSAFLSQPNCQKRTGFRNMVFLVLMYDTAARCQEMLDLRIQDLVLHRTSPCVYLTGKGNKTRVVPILPKTAEHLLFENVPGLLSHDGGRTFATILDTLDRLGYGVEWQCLNSKDFGVPQSRNRVYIVGYLDERCRGKVFPFTETTGGSLIQTHGGHQGERVYSPEGLSCTLAANPGGFGGKTGLYEVGVPIKCATKTGYQMAQVGDSIDLCYATVNSRRGRVGKEIAHTLTTGCQQGTVDVRPVKNPIKSDLARNTERTGKPGAPMHTLTTKDRHGVLYEGRIRRLTPRECLRLQGWADDRIDTVLAIQSDNQAYKQAGNGVTVNVVEAIGRRIAKMDAELRGEALAP